jgi:hypothetical protein
MNPSASSSDPAFRSVASLDADALDDATVESVRVPPLSAEALDALPADHQKVVVRLHRMVEAAVATIQTLRAENARLRQSVEDLQQRPEVPEDATVVSLDAPPDALREQIQGFIALIDRYLEADADAPTGPPPLLSLARPASGETHSDGAPS